MTGSPTAPPIPRATATTQDGDAQDGDGQGEDPGSDAPASHDPSGTGEIMDAGARGGGNGEPGESPVDVIAEEQAWDEAMHQALNLAKAEGKAPGAVEETVRKGAHASTLDWRALLRRYMTDAVRRDYSWSLPNRRFIDSGLYLPSIRSEGIDAIAVIVDTSGSLPATTLAEFWSELREVADRARSRSASSSSRSTPRCRTRPNTPPTTCQTRSRSRAGAAPTSGRASPGSTSRASARGCACISRTWNAPATPRRSRTSRSCGSIIPTRRRTGTASPGANASTSPWTEPPAIGPQPAPPYPHWPRAARALP